MKKYLILSLLLSAFISGFSQNSVVQDTVTLKTPTGDIHGTLLIPNSGKPIPLALIIAGSGPTDRDGNQPSMKNNSLKMLAEGLAQDGIAVLTFDKRGIAKSKGAMKSESELRFEAYIHDVRLWVNDLSKDKRFASIILVGHSEGSLIGMIAAENNPLVAKYVSLAGTGVTLDEILKEQLTKQLASQPAAVRDTCFSYIDKIKRGEKISHVEPGYAALFRPSVQAYLNSVFKYNPQQEIKKLTIPILIIQGAMDIQVKTVNADLLAAANPKAKKVVLDQMNHVLKDCQGTDIASQMPLYTNPDTPINGKVVSEIASFISAK